MDITDVIVPIIFIIISVFRVSRWIRRQSGGNRPRPSGRPTTGQSTSQQSQQPTASSQSSQADSFRKRLEEARKRVIEAQQGNQPQTLSRPQPSTSTSSSADVLLPAPSKSSSGQSSASGSSQAGGLLSPPSTKPIEGYGTSLEGKTVRGYGQSLEGKTVPGYGKSLESKTRKQARASLTSTPAAQSDGGLRVSRKRSRRIPLNMDSTSLIQGIIWREVLSDPVSKRKRPSDRPYHY